MGKNNDKINKKELDLGFKYLIILSIVLLVIILVVIFSHSIIGALSLLLSLPVIIIVSLCVAIIYFTGELLLHFLKWFINLLKKDKKIKTQ